MSILTDSSGLKIFTGVRLETDKTLDSHKNCIKIISTNKAGLNLKECKTLEEYYETAKRR